MELKFVVVVYFEMKGMLEGGDMAITSQVLRNLASTIVILQASRKGAYKPAIHSCGRFGGHSGYSALDLCCVLGEDILLSQCLSPPRSINGYR